jgi:hypothetical protein
MEAFINGDRDAAEFIEQYRVLEQNRLVSHILPEKTELIAMHITKRQRKFSSRGPMISAADGVPLEFCDHANATGTPSWKRFEPLRPEKPLLPRRRSRRRSNPRRQP